MPAWRNILKILPVLLLATAAGPAAAQAARNAVTVYGGYRGGGSFTDTVSNASLGIDDSAAWAISLDLPEDASRRVQLYLSHQRTELDTSNATPATPTRLPLSVTYLHLGGSVYFDGPVGRGPYVVGGLGLTVFDPNAANYSAEVRPSMNLGIGYEFPLGERAALRVEARAYATLVNSSGGFLCSGGCVVSVQGDLVTQGDVQVGLSVRF
jgi:Outer membrane protein beta-barrel domain